MIQPQINTLVSVLGSTLRKDIFVHAGTFQIIKQATKESGFWNKNLMYQIYITPIDQGSFVAAEGNLYVVPSLIKCTEDDEPPLP